MIKENNEKNTSDKAMKQELYKSLMEELSAYEYLLQTMKEKKKAIIRNELNSIESLSGTEHILVTKADSRTAARYSLLQKIFNSNNPSDSPLTLTSFIELCPEEEKGTWERINNRLSRTVENIRYVNNENKNLLETSLKFVNGMINLFIPRDENSDGLYVKEGGSTHNHAAKNLLDCNA